MSCAAAPRGRPPAGALTGRPLPIHDSSKHSVELVPVLGPVATHHRHPHRPQTPAKERDDLQLDLGKVTTPAQHAGFDGQGLDHVEVCPSDVVGDHDRRLAVGDGIARKGEVGAVKALKDDLDPVPHRFGDARG